MSGAGSMCCYLAISHSATYILLHFMICHRSSASSCLKSKQGGTNTLLHSATYSEQHMVASQGD